MHLAGAGGGVRFLKAALPWKAPPAVWQTSRLALPLLLRGWLHSFTLHSPCIRTSYRQTEAEGVKNSDLREILPFGFGIHHAGALSWVAWPLPHAAFD